MVAGHLFLDVHAGHRGDVRGVYLDEGDDVSKDLQEAIGMAIMLIAMGVFFWLASRD